MDVSVNENYFVGIGFVIWDHQGKVYDSDLDRVVKNVDIYSVDSVTLRKAIKFATAELWSRVIIVILSRLLNQKLKLSYLNLILEECKTLKEIFEVYFFFMFVDKGTL